MFSQDELYMARCLQLAEYGEGYVSPNPMVGCVIVHNNKIIGEGYHENYGSPHAEPNAIKSLKDISLLKESTLYVNLEPCSHYGKTPPCVDLIISCHIPRVVIGMQDPNPKVAGNGIRKLEEAGVEVLTGVLEKEARNLNKRFITYFEKKRPYIILKWAQTRDGFIDKIRTTNNTPALAVSNGLTRISTHKMRSQNQAILIGTNTAVLDNPSLTVRYWTGKNPVRLLMDKQQRVPKDYTLFDDTVKTIVYSLTEGENKENIEYHTVKFDNEELSHILEDCYENQINSILVEGGARILNSFLEQNLWDEVFVEVSTLHIGEGVEAPAINRIPNSQREYERHWIYGYKNE